MPSSISSSRSDAPNGPWGATWLAALVAVVAVLWWWEGVAEDAGLKAHVPDDVGTWALERARLDLHGVALLGTSRVLADVIPERVEERLGRPTVQLGVDASSTLPLLTHLDESGFAGIAIVDLMPRCTFFDEASYERKIEERLAAYRTMELSPTERVEPQLRRALVGRLVFRNPALAPSRVSPLWGKLPKPQRAPMTHRRRRLYDVEHIDGKRAERGKAKQANKSPKPAADDVVEERLERLERAVRGIQGRGGRVYLVHFPVSGRLAAAEEKMFPRARFWDRVVENTSATTLHFKDVPAMAALRCFDGSHLAPADAEVFTDALLDVIEERAAETPAP